MGHAPLIYDLSIILAIAAVVAVVFHKIKQPVIVGYILAGSLIGPNSFRPLITNLEEIQVWAELGVVFVMFHLGLEFSFRRLTALGWPTVLYGLWDVGLTGAIGWLAGWVLGLDASSRIFLAGMLAISSTTVIMKAFTELGLRARHFADRVTGLLILEDLAAVILLVALNSFASGRAVSGTALASLGAELVIVVGGWILIGGFVVPRFVRHAGRARNEELLVLAAIGLCLLLSSIAAKFQYSMALGAFIMGSILNETLEGEKIEKLIRPLRDMFAAVFFVTVGLLANPIGAFDNWQLVLTLTAVVIVGKWLVLTSGGLIVGLGLRASTRIGLSMGQVGEFSFLIAAIGLSSGKMIPSLQPTIIAVAILTAFTTPYLIRASDGIGILIEGRLPARLRHSLDRYASHVHHWRSSGALLPEWMKPGLGRLLANSVMVALIFGATDRWIEPMLISAIEEALWRQVTAVVVALAISSPFIVGMLVAAKSRRPKDLEPARSVALRAFTFILFTFLWIGGLSARFISAWASVSVTLALGILIATVFSRRLIRSYAWIESRFMSGLSGKSDENEATAAMKELAPWDAHLVRLQVHPNSKLVGLSLQGSDLKRLHNIIVLSIRRGEDVIAMPPGFELLLPNDELLVLGTDDEMEKARLLIEGPDASRGPSHRFRDYEMRSLKLSDTSPLIGNTIASSQLREKYGALIVGLERDAQRVLNPPIELELIAGDRLWLVGPREGLSALDL
ncbi:MAG: cation:proton antiporter [Bdellovibrionota bacterium]